MALDTNRVCVDVADRVEAAGYYVNGDGSPLEGEDLEAARAATIAGCAFLVGAILDEIVANAEVSVTVSTTVSGTAATDGLGFETFPITETPDGEVLDDAAVSGTGSGTGTGGIV